MGTRRAKEKAKGKAEGLGVPGAGAMAKQDAAPAGIPSL